MVTSDVAEVCQLSTYMSTESNLTSDEWLVLQSLIKTRIYKCKIHFTCWNRFQRIDIMNCYPFDTEHKKEKHLDF